MYICVCVCVLYRHLPIALDEFEPDVVVYNAGTDILEGDRLGNLDITPEVERVCVALAYTHRTSMNVSTLKLRPPLQTHVLCIAKFL